MDPSLSASPTSEVQEAPRNDLHQPPSSDVVAPEERVAELTDLLADLDDPPHFGRGSSLKLSTTQENNLIQVRLGIASSLYAALKWKHEPTARHCLRVALNCSVWAHRLGLPQERRDEIEVAALLHDIGKIGVPDQILAKPCPLSRQETAVMDGHWLMGLEILRGCCASQGVQEIVMHARAWFDGTKEGLSAAGEEIPLGARMLSIVDAYDAMTTDHVYRPARPRERALHELFSYGGRQFDRTLVKSFSELHECDERKLIELVPRRWLQILDPSAANAAWGLNSRAAAPPQLFAESLFQQRLIENMDDAVIFVDAALRILRWNPAAERLTGVSGESVYHRLWLPSLLRVRDEHGCVIRDEQCPVAYSIRTGTPWMRRLNVRGREGRVLAIDAHAMPVHSEDGTVQGLALVLHDASQETTLQERCQNLHEMATRDPLTQLANRSEFDRLLDVFVTAHAEKKRPCSLIMSDIDFFKEVNDNFGHQAGDEVIRSFAALLKGSCRAGDLVARYGGEEFVMLCADCDSGTVARRAEQLRSAFGRTPHDELSGKMVTASFGVTEIQPGDTPDTMLRRADRALLTAKEEGRNKVVQLGSGNETADQPLKWPRRRPAAGDVLVEQRLASGVPLSVSVEKLRGFIADHHAHVASLSGNRVALAITCGPPARPFLHDAQRPSHFTMELEYSEQRAWHEGPDGVRAHRFIRTLIKVAVRTASARDRRQKLAAERARQLLISLRAYLMAIEPVDGPETSVLERAKHLFAPWWAKK
ncbi:MAG: diguanylate cyclase [Planctomycetia bacterium]|nr:diguanylate cyclase [Planctomycetia bacterium]